MTIAYNINPKAQGVNGFALPISDNIWSATLAANTDTTLNVPTDSSIGMTSGTPKNKFIAVIGYAMNVLANDTTFVAVNATAAEPVGAAFAATTSLINPTGVYCKAGDVLHFISRGTPDITVAFYAIQD